MEAPEVGGIRGRRGRRADDEKQGDTCSYAVHILIGAAVRIARRWMRLESRSLRAFTRKGPPVVHATTGAVQPPCFGAGGPSSSVRLISNPKFSVRKNVICEKGGWESGACADIQHCPAPDGCVLMSSTTHRPLTVRC